MQLSMTFAGGSRQIMTEINSRSGDLPSPVLEACVLALSTVSPVRPVILETSGFCDGASSDIRIEIKTCDAIV